MINFLDRIKIFFSLTKFQVSLVNYMKKNQDEVFNTGIEGYFKLKDYLLTKYQRYEKKKYINTIDSINKIASDDENIKTLIFNYFVDKDKKIYNKYKANIDVMSIMEYGCENIKVYKSNKPLKEIEDSDNYFKLVKVNTKTKKKLYLYILKVENITQII